ncbi:hypothetical protein GGR57DRAFT_350678 [Xylariaceae sp. FL1272]|nr:hypothetical protein GGR57DRAFT_350678 [Xylariaceae sp. FL1272]
MSSNQPGSKPYALQIAQRIHNTTGKDQLPQICMGGFFLETLWHSVIERRAFNTSAPVIKKALLRAAVLWPGLYIATSAALAWAERRVGEAAKAEKPKSDSW